MSELIAIDNRSCCLGQYWTGGSNPNLNAGRDRIDRRTYSNPLIGLISPSVIPGSNHLCRFSILVPFSFLHRSPPFLLAHSRAQLIDPSTLIILASARCPHWPRGPLSLGPLRSAITLHARRSAVSVVFSPALHSLFSFFSSPLFSPSPSLSLLARASRCSPRRSLGKLVCFCICLVQRPIVVQRWLTPCRFRLRHWCRWPQRHLRQVHSVPSADGVKGCHGAQHKR